MFRHLGRTIRENTPDKFEHGVLEGLQEVERKPPIVELEPEDIKYRSNYPIITPPPDPLGEVNPQEFALVQYRQRNQQYLENCQQR